MHPLLWPSCSPFICTATSSSGPRWTPAMMRRRAPRAAACPNLRTSPSTARWWRPTCAAPRPRTTACRRARRARATAVTRRTRSWATTPASWQTSTGARRTRGGRASPCTMASSTPILSTSPSTWVRAQQHVHSSAWPPEFFSLTFLNSCRGERWRDLGQACLRWGFSYWFLFP